MPSLRNVATGVTVHVREGKAERLGPEWVSDSAPNESDAKPEPVKRSPRPRKAATSKE